MGKCLNRNQIAGAKDLGREWVPTPEWGDGDHEAGVWVRTISGAERDDFEAGSLEGKGRDARTNLRNFRARFCALVMVDDAGGRLFLDGMEDDLGQRSAKVLDRVFAVAQRLNGMTREDVDFFTKPSTTSQTSSSGSV